ncbi:hypothetical protein [Parabacteroides sp. PF5-9]|uniref:hypothetical protein n=1 Tax=Parabacteroides sp. PF5-9 TaxID=1742404 RepID=UPI00247365D6|nr:hypothetical protein [Parabacteroides sp. PF5-9]MDH6358695.1 hypothetical protein [Parabacteroides sp. PF5-9]
MNKYCLIVLASSLLSISTMESQVFYNTGKVTVAAPAITNGASLYIDGGMRSVGTSGIKHVGKTVLTGSLFNDVTSGHMFSQRGGIFEFKGTTVQRIGGTADKANQYVEFPETVIVNNTNTAHSNDSAVVIIEPTMGVTMKNLTLTRGRLVIDSKVNGDATDIAHLLVESSGTVNYNHTSSKSTAGVVQVNLAMGSNATEGGLAGFSSPFKSIYSDYFFFNFMAIPKTDMFFAGNRDLWNLDPTVQMTAGKGYVIGQGIVPHTAPHNAPGGYYYTHKNTAYSAADYGQVAKERFSFARLFANNSSWQTYMSSKSDRFTGEELNTTTVIVPIVQGFNYLGNPYTVPLDLSSFVTLPSSSDWGGVYDIEAKFYILSPNSTGTYNAGSGLFSFTSSYLVGQKTGGTAPSNTVAPMQMFAVKKSSTGTSNFRINAGARTHGNISFLRSGQEQPEDELLIETKDLATGGFDRICMVLRPTASLKGNDMYDAEKLFNTTGGVNQIYTRSEDGVNLTTNVIPTSTRSVVMYFMPSAKAQEVLLTADRISSLISVGSVILEDRITGMKTNLMVDPSYTFNSSPLDEIDRFVLHFNAPLTGIETIGTEALSAQYRGSTLYIKGLNENHLGRNVVIYDMQGVLVHSERITEIAPCRIDKSLAKGVYIIHIDGDNVIKFTVN